LPPLKDIPDEFVVAKPLVVKNQRGTDFCATFAGTSVSEDQEGVELDPCWQFAQTKKIMGNLNWGANLRDMAKSFTKFGSIEQKEAPFTVQDDRQLTADWKSYNIDLNSGAEDFKKESYMFISGQYDLFDNIRATLWYNRNKKQTVVTGVKWCKEWRNAFVDKMGTPTEGHAIKIFGATKRNNRHCLIVLNSYGQSSGDNGKFYFTREVINEGFKYGALTFTDIPKKTADYHIQHKIKVDQNWLLQLLILLKNICKKN